MNDKFSFSFLIIVERKKETKIQIESVDTKFHPRVIRWFVEILDPIENWEMKIEKKVVKRALAGPVKNFYVRATWRGDLFLSAGPIYTRLLAATRETSSRRSRFRFVPPPRLSLSRPQFSPNSVSPSLSSLFPRSPRYHLVSFSRKV